MRKLSTFVDCLLITAVAVAAPTANEDFVVAEDAKTYTNAVNAANAYTDGKIAEIPAPDYSTNNTELVETIQATAPMPDNYANASMPARLRMSLPEDSEFIEPVSIFDMYGFVFDDMPGKPRVVFRNGAFHIDCEYGSAVGIRDDFEGTVSFYLPDTPFEYYEFRYSMSPVATIEKVNLTAQALANTIDYSTNNTELVETIEAKAPTPDLSPFLRNDKQDSEVQIFGGRLSGFGFHADTGHNDNGWNQYTAHNGTALAQPLPSYIQSNPWNFLKQGEAIPTTGGVFNAYIHLNHKFSVGTWTQYVKPIESVGGSGIAFAFGDNVQTRAANTMVLGVGALNTNDWSFIWNGDANRMYFPTQPNMSNPYSTRYNGGFHVNPSVRTGMTNPLQNFWIGDTNLATWISIMEADPTVPQWAKAATKPSYTAAEVGAYSTNETMYVDWIGDIGCIYGDYMPSGVWDFGDDCLRIANWYQFKLHLTESHQADGIVIYDFDDTTKRTVLPINGSDVATIADIPDVPATVSNIVTAAYINDRVNVTPLAGRTYDFATNIGLYTAVRDVILALGGSVTNFPAIPQN